MRVRVRLSVPAVRQLPWDIEDARDVLAQASRDQRDHQNVVRDAVKAAARADQVYRVELARRITELREAGQAAVLCDKLARGDPRIAELARDAMIAEGDKEIAISEGYRLHANRADSQELADWSKRRQLAEGYGSGPGPQWSKP